MSLQAGHKLAHYEILEPIGKGGMGEVYRAKDSKLGRDVAIKVLPDEFAENEERLARFKREAKVLASLNHPGIASIYGLEESKGTHYLVLELVPGETLAERISRGPIPVEEALEIAAKIAEALEEAHEHGIVHRDLKPANIKQTEDGKIKVLDFGLAKVFQEETPDADSSMSPTLTRDATRVGVILGTAAYMSPEQAKGKKVDKRTDIFAFGAVLYEMLTGKKAFPGEDVSEVLASVIKLEPDWSSLPNELPPTVDRLIRRCLSKDTNRRLQHIGDARIEIEEAVSAPTLAIRGAESHQEISTVRFNATSVASMIVAISAIGIALWSLAQSERAVPGTVTRTSISLQTGDEFYDGANNNVAISPDGLKVAYIATRSDSTTQLFLRAIDQLEAEPIAGSASS
jgi:serine/threonine protein kinase